MDPSLLRHLKEITPEEKAILAGNGAVDQSLYTSSRDFIIDNRKLLEKGKLIEIRPHTRFIRFPRHRHNYIEMVYMCAGSTTHILNDAETVRLEEGDLLLLNQNATHEILPAGEDDIAVNFIILPQFFDYAIQVIGQGNVLYNFIRSALSSELGVASYLQFRAKNILPVQNLLENLIWTILQKSPDAGARDKLSMGLLFLTLLDYAEPVSQGDYNPYDQRLVLAALKYIDASYPTASLEEFCRIRRVKPYTASRLLKKHTGKNFKELLKERRLQQAAFLLENTTLPTEAVFHAIGYENSSFFHRIFREAYGQSPQEFRRSSRRD